MQAAQRLFGFRLLNQKREDPVRSTLAKDSHIHVGHSRENSADEVRLAVEVLSHNTDEGFVILPFEVSEVSYVSSDGWQDRR
jgi:hypothetical protein